MTADHSTLGALATMPADALHRRIESWAGRQQVQYLLYWCLRAELDALLKAPAISPPSEIARMLAPAQSAFRDLEGLLAGRPTRLPDELRDGEWSLRDLLRHAIAVELRYATQVHYSAMRREDEPVAIPPERLSGDRLAPPEPEFGDSRTGDIPRMMELLALARTRTDALLSPLPLASLSRLSLWGTNELTVRERIHQITAHLVEVVVQTEKMLQRAGREDGEPRRILRRIRALRGLHELATPAADMGALDARLESIVSLTRAFA